MNLLYNNFIIEKSNKNSEDKIYNNISTEIIQTSIIDIFTTQTSTISQENKEITLNSENMFKDCDVIETIDSKILINLRYII